MANPQNGQAPYPTESWMDQLRPNPQLNPEEWAAWQQGPIQGAGIRALKDHDLGEFLKSNPDGFVTDANHPGLKDIRTDAEIMSIPERGREQDVFVRARQKVAKMLPTSGQGVQVLEQAAGRASSSRAKRREAEAM